MTIPAELVQAAAEELHRFECNSGHPYTSHEVVYLRWERKATVALQAAFAKLPECEAAVNVLDEAMTFYVMDHGVPAPGGERLRMLRHGLAALAQEFGGKL